MDVKCMMERERGKGRGRKINGEGAGERQAARALALGCVRRLFLHPGGGAPLCLGGDEKDGWGEEMK